MFSAFIFLSLHYLLPGLQSFSCLSSQFAFCSPSVNSVTGKLDQIGWKFLMSHHCLQVKTNAFPRDTSPFMIRPLIQSLSTYLVSSPVPISHPSFDSGMLNYWVARAVPFLSFCLDRTTYPTDSICWTNSCLCSVL